MVYASIKLRRLYMEGARMKDFMNSNIKIYLQKAVVILVLSTLVGCSSVQDNLNPVEWYKDARDVVVSWSEEKQKEKKIPSSEAYSSGGDRPFPKLSSVPKLSKVAVPKKSKSVPSGLLGDNEKSRAYSTDVSGQNKGTKNSVPLLSSLAAPLPPSLPTPLPVPRNEKKDIPVASKKPTNSSDVNMQKLSAVGQPQQRKVSAVKPNSRSMASILNLAPARELNETVVVSGSGSHKMSIQNQPNVSNVMSPLMVSRGTSFLRNNTANLQRSYQVATILFQNGSANMGARDRRVLRQVIVQHKKVGGTLRVIGHASRRTKTNDPIRHKMVNFKVSAARADGVANELIKMGVKANKLVVASVSDSNPLYFEYMPSGEAGNRRTDIFIDF